MKTRIAVLLTCFNRKKLTLNCLNNLFKAYNLNKEHITISIYLTDDNSNDGTSDAVHKLYPEIHILKGNGSLFWAGGMRNSWKEAIKGEYDYYLLLNDDSVVVEDLFAELDKINNYTLNKYNKQGVYVGSTADPVTGKLSYGGNVLTNKLKATTERVALNGQYQECDMGNANILFVPQAVVDKIGILHDEYEHGRADYDYTYMANKNKIPVIVFPEFCGVCAANDLDRQNKFKNLSLKDRFKFLKSPIGLGFKDALVFEKRFFVLRYPLVLFMGYFKVLFPSIYFKIKNI